jgi:hypothetical protein
MRLGNPKIRKIVCDGGKSTLYRGASDAHRDGGTQYRFDVDWTGRQPIATQEKRMWKGVGELAIFENNVLRCWLVVKAKDPWYVPQFQAEVANFEDLDMSQRVAAREAWSDKHGDQSVVMEFGIPFEQLTAEQILELRDRFAAAFFELTASYRYNNDDPAADPKGYYPDQLVFHRNVLFKLKSPDITKTFNAPRGIL